MTTLTITEQPVTATVSEDVIALTVSESPVTLTIADGVTDHGALNGLEDDDHPQYLTQLRANVLYALLVHTHDDRYFTENEITTLLASYLSISGYDWTTLPNKPTTFTPNAHTHAQSEITNLVSDLATKATQAALLAHEALTTSAHGGIVPNTRTITINGQIFQLNANAVYEDINVAYQVNNIDDDTATDVLYVGLEKSDGTWWIKKLDETVSPTTLRHATNINNGAYSTYTAAWSARTSLTYSLFDTAF